MTIKIYGSTNRSTTKARKWFESQNIRVHFTNIDYHALSTGEISHILSLTEDGTDEIIAKKSKAYKDLNLNFEELSLNSLFEYIKSFPKLVRTPLIFNEDKLQVGYDEQEIRKFIPKQDRKASLWNILTGKQETLAEGV